MDEKQKDPFLLSVAARVKAHLDELKQLDKEKYKQDISYLEPSYNFLTRTNVCRSLPIGAMFRADSLKPNEQKRINTLISRLAVYDIRKDQRNGSTADVVGLDSLLEMFVTGLKRGADEDMKSVDECQDEMDSGIDSLLKKMKLFDSKDKLAGGARKVSKYTKTDKKVQHCGRKYCVYVGRRGGEYIKAQGQFVALRTFTTKKPVNQ